jgi:aspartate aminotransferase-like enzyme
VIKSHLLAPGPTPLPPEVLAAMARPIVYHRGPEYEALFQEVRQGLRAVFQTANEVLVFAASGTGAMEAAVVNTCSPGERVLVIRGGKFGERWGQLCAAYGLRATTLDVEWGRAVEPARVAEALAADPGIRAVFATHSETSTGVLHDIEALAGIVRPTPALLVVDGITSVGVVDVPMDGWGIDVLVTGSQKALMLPPGLAFCGVSDKAWAAVAQARLPRFYFDFAAERKSMAKNQNAFTPAVSLLAGLQAALRLIRAEGLPHVFARHARLARGCRAAMGALGLAPFPERPSPAATVASVPPGLDGGAIVRQLRERHGITIAGGQDRLKGKIVRIAHMGYVDESDVVVGIAALERTLAELGYGVKPGDGVAAAQRAFLEA